MVDNLLSPPLNGLYYIKRVYVSLSCCIAPGSLRAAESYLRWPGGLVLFDHQTFNFSFFSVPGCFAIPGFVEPAETNGGKFLFLILFLKFFYPFLAFFAPSCSSFFWNFVCIICLLSLLEIRLILDCMRILFFFFWCRLIFFTGSKEINLNPSLKVQPFSGPIKKVSL